MLPIASLNGKQMAPAEARVSALDRGFLFGDGVYEVVRIYRGQPFLFREHWDRLARSLREIRLHSVSLEGLEREARELIAAAGPDEATLYVQVTRGAGATRSHFFPSPTSVEATRFLLVAPFPEMPAEKRSRGVGVITLPDLRWDRCDIKSLNLLANVMAAQAAEEVGAAEALLVTKDGQVTEGSRSNFFVVKNGKLLTTPLSEAILPGVTRAFVLKLAAQLGIETRDEVITRKAIAEADEMFLSSTTSEVLPIVTVDGTPVGSGKPGPIAQKLYTAFREAVALL